MGKVVLMKYLLASLFIVLINVSTSASAHLKWFAVDDSEINLTEYYSAYSIELIIGSILFLLCAGIAAWINRHIPFEVKKITNADARKYITRAFSILIGLSLLYASYSETIIAAHYLVTNKVLVILQYAQAVVAFMLILNLFPRIAAVVLIGIYLVLATQFGVLEVLDYINFIGIALYLILSNSADERQRDYAVPAIRVITGVTLVILAFSEKFLHPNLGMRFLADNDWNFMLGLGMSSFSNELFILAAGLVELLIGVLLMLGLLTRVNTVVLLAFMITSNVMFLIQNSNPEALTELAGHMPVIAIALILLMAGSGKKWKLV
jgi:uncharacterized membrane protein YphA (DoxX/SURF4 family)